MLRFKKPVLAQVLFLTGLLGAFGVGNYYPRLYLGEMAGLGVIFLYLWLVLKTRVKSGGYWLVVVPVLALVLFVLLYAFVFSARTGAPLLPSMLAQRDLAFFLLAPAVYLLSARGWGLVEFQRVFVLAVLLAMANYVAVLATVDFESWVGSGNPYLEAQVTYDETRGYRLKGPTFVFLFAVLYFGRGLWRAKSALRLVSGLALTALPVALLAVNAPRSAVLSVVAALVLYGVFLSRARSIGVSVILAPVLISLGFLLVPYLINAFMTTFGNDPSYEVRVESAEQAWDYFLRYPLLGVGQESYQSISYHDLLGNRFYPSDIGLLGVAFQYGLVGVFVYLSFSLWILMNLLKLLRLHAANMGPEQVSFLWALFIICLAFFIVSPLQAKFIYGEGIAIGAFSWGLLLAHRQGSLGSSLKNERGRTDPVGVVRVQVKSDRTT